jgi:hypothetical protein
MIKEKDKDQRTHTEKTSAETITVAFDYQYYFFLWKVLALKLGQSVGLEVKDDVHIELEDGTQILYQLKHTVSTKSDKTAINLTESDKDLWHTLSNWAKVISDKNDGRGDKAAQLEFLKRTTFVLASNKSSAPNNSVTNALDDFKQSKTTCTSVKKIMTDLRDKSKSDTTKQSINDVLGLGNDVLKMFFSNIYFELAQDNLIDKCKNEILSCKIEKELVDGVFADVDSTIKADNYLNVKKGEKITITFDGFYEKYRRFFQNAQNPNLKIEPYDGCLDGNLEDQKFIQQLVDIGDIDITDIESISEFTLFKLQLSSNLDRWLQSGDLINKEIEQFWQEAIARWKNIHHSKNRGNITDDDQLNARALQIIDEVRKELLQITAQDLGSKMSNGCYYKLSDDLEIGWRKDWKERYTNES